jgi:aspartate/methionine/tyrosine aminotransferase
MQCPHDIEARQQVRSLRSSRIREVANAAIGREDVLPFWFGEPDEATPEHICRAAIEAIDARQTFYTPTLGLPRLREAIAEYVTRLHRPTGADSVAVTSSGTSALMLAIHAVVGAGDRVVAVTPLWPNLVEMPKVLGAQVTTVALTFASTGWQLDLQGLLDALTPGTRALLLNSPNNPTGWTLSREMQEAILAHCRRLGIWIISDDVYERIYYEGACAPSFLAIAHPQDRVISCNSFSKAWLMTGWRLGWVVVPPGLLPEIGKLIEYSTTCAPPFVQCAGVAALEGGEPFIGHTVARLRRGRDHLHDHLRAVAGLLLAQPSPGAMYTFLKVPGLADSLGFCQRLVASAGLGLAPGAAFGPEGEGYLRWCYASSTERLDDGVRRLAAHLDAHPLAS